jgi:hypothetical protein
VGDNKKIHNKNCDKAHTCVELGWKGGMIISLSLLGRDAEGNGRDLISGTNSEFAWRDLGKNNFSHDGQLHVVHAPRVDDHCTT